MNKNLKAVVLFAAGMIGLFVYLIITELQNSPFHVEWLLAFLAMMGISITQGVDKK